MTAAEAIAERQRMLREDPAYRRQVEAIEADRARGSQAHRKAERPVIDDLASVGIRVPRLDDLSKQPEVHDKAVPVLLRHLGLDYPDSVLRAIGSPLAKRASRPWWDELRALYLTAERPVVRSVLASALAVCARREHYDDLLRFVADESLGDSRIFFLRPINRIGNRINPGQGRSVIERFTNDRLLGAEAIAILNGRSRTE
jgi:hypothetical protein